MLNHPELDLSEFKHSVWILGILSCVYGTFDRVFAMFSTSYLSLVEVFNLMAVSCLLMAWIYLKPEPETSFFDSLTEIETPSWIGSEAIHDAVHLQAAQNRMQALNQHHIIHQLHVLPYPFICQIYHLLNLKHLESVHSVSLSNLKVVEVSHLAPTELGGTIRFQTKVESPLSILKLWRQPTVEVDLTLHSLYTVELSIPVYAEKRMTVIFNAFPLGKDQHEFLIDIYTDLNWPKPLLQLILHLASLVTLYEDLPYLQQLSKREWLGLLRKQSNSKQNVNWLFDRFVELYAVSLEDSLINQELEGFNLSPA